MEMVITLFLCGDVMLGRGIDQMMADSVDPRLHEPYVRDARHYQELAARNSGIIPEPADPGYVWGDALGVFELLRPSVRLINLETAITTNEEYAPEKDIHYRMHPANVAILEAGGIDVCVLANNHVLDWGREGLRETLDTLGDAGIKSAGAGKDLQAAASPAVVDIQDSVRVLVYAYAMPDSGVSLHWAATPHLGGVQFLPDLSLASVEKIAARIRDTAREKDIVVFSVHWGGNWGFDISKAQRRFAHHLIDQARVDIFHGHSSHHVKGLEVYQGRPIFYGCGDFFNDYEGIGGHEAYRPDLTLMYFPTIDLASHRLSQLLLRPMRIQKFRLNHADKDESTWLETTLNRESRRFGVRVFARDTGELVVHWQ